MSDEQEEPTTEEPKSNVLSFKLELVRIPVELEVPDGPILEAYLEELTGRQRDQYLNDLTSKIQMKGGKMDKMKTFDGLQSFLLTLCLRKKTDDKLFTKSEIEAFPAKVQEALYDAAQELSGLEVEVVDDGKNDSRENDSDGSD